MSIREHLRLAYEPAYYFQWVTAYQIDEWQAALCRQVVHAALNPAHEPRRFHLAAARQSGKSEIVAALAGWLAAFGRVGETVALTAPSERQSMYLLGKVKKRIRQLGPSTNFIRKVKRVPRGTEYADVLNALAYEQSRLPACPTWVDCTGNRAIRELANNMGVAIDAIQMTSGDEYHVKWNELGFRSISKSALVFSLQASLERGELKIPNGPDGDALVEELSHYQMVRTATGQATWRNVGAANDDLVIAVALGSFALNEAHNGVIVEPPPWSVTLPQQQSAPKNPAGKTNEQLAVERSTILVRG